MTVATTITTITAASRPAATMAATISAARNRPATISDVRTASIYPEARKSTRAPVEGWRLLPSSYECSGSFMASVSGASM